jgi:hypothetical protein
MSTGGQRRIETKDTGKARPRWIDCCLVMVSVIGGLGWNWWAAFEWFSGRFALCSGPVLRMLGLIVLPCAAAGFFAGYMVEGKWRGAVLVFLLASVFVSGNMLLWWGGHR